MDHMDDALSPYMDGFYLSGSIHDVIPQNVQQPERNPHQAEETDQLVEQSQDADQYISHATITDGSSDNSIYFPGNTSYNLGLYLSKDSVIHDTFTPNESVYSSYLGQIDVASQYADAAALSKKHADKYKTDEQAFDKLQERYSDLIHLSDMENYKSRYQPLSAPRTQSATDHHLSFIQAHTLYEESSNDTSYSDFMSWTCKHPEQWSKMEVLDWLYYSAEKHGVDCSLLRGEAFGAVNGGTLCKMGPDDFTALEPYHGQLLFTLFRQFMNNSHVIVPIASRLSVQSPHDELDNFMKSDTILPSSNCDLSESHSSDNLIPVISSNSPDTYNSQSIHDGYCCNYASIPASETPPSVPMSQNYECIIVGLTEYDNTSYDYQANMYSSHTTRSHADFSTVRDKYHIDVPPVRRRRGRPRIKSIPTAEELEAQREKKLKNQHLWEFIYDMLSSTVYNPSILKWENQTEGVFRFIQSESVAQLWGSLKCNENMTYEKLSRAMRHYYKRDILQRVEGRRLVYKFSRITLEKMKQRRCSQTISAIQMGECTLISDP